MRSGNNAVPADLSETTIADLQAAMNAGDLAAVSLADYYLRRIEALDRTGPAVNSIVEVNPDAFEIAESLDRERQAQGPRGPMHGIPVVIKDNIDTADRMHTTAGSLALMGAPAVKDANVVAKLRAAGAVILAKTNMCEWAGSRSPQRHPGWSGRGGQTRNPYVLNRSPSGSSGGAAAAVAANFAAVALGTETDGSIMLPAGVNGVVGIRPTLGLTSCAGVVPVSHNLDVVGTFGRTVADAATLLSVVAGKDASANGRNDCHYEDSFSPNGLKGARIGVVRERLSGIHDRLDPIYEDAVRAMSDAGAVIVDPADIPTLFEISTRVSQNIVLCCDLKQDLNIYLKSRTGIPARSLAEVIAFNQAHAESELTLFGQQLFEQIETSQVDQAKYQQGLARMRKIGGALGIDAVLQRFRLNALVMPTGPPASVIDYVNGQIVISVSSMPAAIAGYPSISVPMGNTFGLPVGITFVGTAFQEKTLIRLASGFEHVRRARTSPKFLRTLPFEYSEFWHESLAGNQRLDDNLPERERDDRKITLQ